MKKSFKRILALLVSFVMVFAMATTVFSASNNTAGSRINVPILEDASTKGSISIANETQGATYTAYQVYSAEVKPGDNTYTWTPVTEFEDVLQEKAITKVEDILKLDANALKEFAKALESDTTKPSGTTDLDDLSLGYYLLVETGTTGLSASQPILVAIPQVQNNQWVYNITVAPKSSSTDFTKKIAENGKLVDTNTKNIGDYVDYRLWADVPAFAESCYTDENIPLVFEITDEMSNGLTWGAKSSINVYTIDAYSEENIVDVATTGNPVSSDLYEINPYVTEETAGGTFTVKFNKAFLTQYKNKIVVVTFKAQLNNNAAIANSAGKTIDGYTDENLKDQNYNGQGNPNAAKLTYTNEFDATSNSGTNEIKDIVTTFTFKLDVEKVDKDNKNTKLAGAEFAVYTGEECSEDTEYANTKFVDGKLTTQGETGSATGEGFDAGTYYLVETKAPAGYKLYDGKIKVEIVGNKNSVSQQYDGTFSYTITMIPKSGTAGGSVDNKTIVTVMDEKGITLPGTGGIGTTIFTFGGLALIILAAVMFFVYTRKQKKQS